MSDTLTESLVAAAEYAVAKVIALGMLSCDDGAVRELARESTKAILDELRSREQQLLEVAPSGETTTSRDEHAIRVMEYGGVVKDLGGVS